MTKLTPLDRLMLSNQYRILEKLYPEEAEYFAIEREALEGGFELIYMEYLEKWESVLTEEECREVYDTLQLFSILEMWAGKLGETDWLKKQPNGTFSGYDGNNETKFMIFVRYIIERREQFKDLLPTGYYNSHSPMRHEYQSMVARWREISSRNYGVELSMDNIKKILQAD